jgi:hypothetical protein
MIKIQRIFGSFFKPLGLTIIIASLFFIGASSFNYFTQTSSYVHWTSPDETANYFFAKKYATDQTLIQFEPANLAGSNLVHPRSVRSDGTWLKPVSFLGIILIYGQIGHWLSPVVIPYLTPFFGALGLIIFYGLISRWRTKRTALASTFLLAVFPVYIYYSARSMFHNILFIVLLLGGIYFLTLALNERYQLKAHPSFLSKKPSWPAGLSCLWALLAGALFGLTIITRTSELLWLAPASLIAVIFYGRRLGLIRLFIFFAGLWIGLMPALYWNQILYQSPVYGGYSEMNQSLNNIAAASQKIVNKTLSVPIKSTLVAISSTSTVKFSYQQAVNQIFNSVFYFGFKGHQSFHLAKIYIGEMFPWLAILGFLGYLWLLIRSFRRGRRVDWFYLTILPVISMILIFYYGSWIFNDNPNVHRYTIGNSYTRYWLPIYLLLIPLAVIILEKLLAALLSFFKSRKVKDVLITGLLSLAVIIIAFQSVCFVLFGSEEGLIYAYYNSLNDRWLAQTVGSVLPTGAIIITQYHDKVFFPEHRVIVSLLTDAYLYPYFEKIIHYYPLYYFNFTYPEKSLGYLNDRRLQPVNLHLELIKNVGTFSLYRLNLINKTYGK